MDVKFACLLFGLFLGRIDAPFLSLLAVGRPGEVDPLYFLMFFLPMDGAIVRGHFLSPYLT